MDTLDPAGHAVVDDTIAAVATAPGRGGIGIVRVSGPEAAQICEQICGKRLAPRHATLARFMDAQGEAIDSGIAVYFVAPRSYTGEDVVELQGHGGVVVQQLVLARVIECGARRAQPGEFTQRAFLNGKMDLAQAEAVADLIDASSEHAALAAQRSLSGAFSDRVNELASALSTLRVHVEAHLDFADEDIDPDSEADLRARCQALIDALDKGVAAARAGRRLNDAVNVVLVGEPNVGKSSLLNALLGTQRAIVTDRPGTTRDAIMEHITLHGLHIQLSDTAGLRDSTDEVELAGMAITRERLAQADIAVLVRDASAPQDAWALDVDGLKRSLPTKTALLSVANKIDIGAQLAGKRDEQIYVSAKTGAGLPCLERALVALAERRGVEGDFSARARHVDGLVAARERARCAQLLLVEEAEPELVAEELRLAQGHLAELTGRVTSDDLLGQIFASFCIGK